MSLIRDYQLDIMLFMVGICTALSLTILMIKSLPRKRKGILASMSVSAAVLLVFERFAYIYRGDPSVLGFYMVRISNALVFFLLLFIPFLVTQYIKNLYENEGKSHTGHISFNIADVLFVIGTLLLVISQFTDLYYSFDANNVYQRSPGIVISYLPPTIIVLLQTASLIRNRSLLSRGLFCSLLLSLILPLAASVAQLFVYGISWTCMTMALVVIIYYIYLMNEMRKAAEKARTQEIEFYKEAQKIEAAMFDQTVEALVSAIDAKDIYTRGHSSRVATYSKRIAEHCKLSEQECDDIYSAALLHDVGKIGIPDGIINKPGKLTDEEFELIKSHTVMGAQILSSIKQAPFLSDGAHFHHERYDGTGYPEGLAGTEIPQSARIIAIADAYDAMTSKRSYRDPLLLAHVKQELIDGSGKQFDPYLTQIMLQMIADGETASYEHTSFKFTKANYPSASLEPSEDVVPT